MPKELPKFERGEDPADCAIKLRLAVFGTQSATAAYYRVNPGSISKYESGAITPPPGYLASLSRLLLSVDDQVMLSDAERASQQQFLLAQIRELMRWFPDKYKRDLPFSNWDQLCVAADQYESKHLGRPGASAPIKALDSERQPGRFDSPTLVEVQAQSRQNTSSGPTSTDTSLPQIGPAPGSAPPIPTLLLGRDEDLRQLKYRLGVGVSAEAPVPLRVLTAMRGWPGVGKTSLAAALAHDHDIRQRFPDGILWASLGQNPSIFAELLAWGRALGHPDIERVSSIQEASARLSGLLHNQRRLLIVDDVWEVPHARPFQVGGQHCALLLTTRLPEVAEAIAPPDDIYLLDVSSEEAALELLRILAPGVVAAEFDACKVLVKELEGLPLAIEVAGRLLQSEARLGFGVATLLAELREGSRLLKAQAPADRAEVSNQTTPTIAALLQKSTDRLKFRARACFAYLGAFAAKPATFDEIALKSVWQVADPRPMIRILVNRGLLEPMGSGRFWLSSLLVEHARALLTDSIEQAESSTVQSVDSESWMLAHSLSSGQDLSELDIPLIDEPFFSVNDDSPSCYQYLLQALHPNGLCCPNGHHLPANQRPHKRPANNGRQTIVSYRCRKCKAVFNALTSTPLAGTHYPCGIIVRFLQGLKANKTVHRLAGELGCDYATLLKWRRRLAQDGFSTQSVHTP
ncbi:MAG TPA: NB-ARC domain-containing protein [Chloroflexia bacterium]|jgi:transposase-like protein